MVDVHGQVLAVQHGGGAALVDVAPAAVARLAQRLDVRPAGEDIAAVAADVRPPGAGERLRPGVGERRGGAVHREGAVAGGAEVAVVDGRLHRGAVGAADARAEADHRVVEEEPRLLRQQRGLKSLQILADRRPLSVGGAAHPVHVGQRGAPVTAGGVREDLARGGGAGQPAGVDGGPEGVAVLAVAEGVAPPVEQSGTGVPAAQVLAVAGLVVRDPAVGHAQRGGPAGSAVGGAGHAGEQAVPGRLGDRCDRRVVQDRLQPGQVRQTDRGVAHRRAVVVALQPALDQAAPTGRLGRARALSEQNDRGEDRMTAQVIVLLDLLAVGRGQSPADRPAGDPVHDQAVVEERRPRVLHRVEHDLPLGVGDRPGRLVEQCEQQPEPAEQHRAVGAGVGHGGVLDERSVGVQPVPTADIGEDRGEGVPGERHLRGAAPNDAAQRQHPAQVDPVGASAGPGVGGDR